jgi:hypothetical protein
MQKGKTGWPVLRVQANLCKTQLSATNRVC